MLDTPRLENSTPSIPTQGPARMRTRSILADEPIPQAPRAVPSTTPKHPAAQGSKRAQTPFHAAPAAEKQAALSPGPGDTALADFLGACCPAMGHCESAFRRAGVTQRVHLAGMAHWTEDNLRKFLSSYGIARTPLEEQAIVLSFSVSISFFFRLRCADVLVSLCCSRLLTSFDI